MNINVGVSNRHVHLTEEDYLTLFGSVSINIERELNQKGEFASSSIVKIVTNKNEINNVRVIGPIRKYTQVEISKTDAFYLGIAPPVRMSGDLTDAVVVKIVGPNGIVEKPCCILAQRHVHISPDERSVLGLKDKADVTIRVGGVRPVIFPNVKLKESDNGVFEFHIDTDEANSCLLKSGDVVEII